MKSISKLLLVIMLLSVSSVFADEVRTTEWNTEVEQSTCPSASPVKCPEWKVKEIEGEKVDNNEEEKVKTTETTPGPIYVLSPPDPESIQEEEDNDDESENDQDKVQDHNATRSNKTSTSSICGNWLDDDCDGVENREEKTPARKDLRGDRSESILKHKEKFYNKIGKKIEKVPEAKLDKLLLRIETVIIKIENNDKISDKKKLLLNDMLIALQEVIEDQLANSNAE